MAGPEDIVSSIPMEIPEELLNNLSFLVHILEALGAAILLYIIFNVINIMISRRKEKEIQKISKDLEAIKKLLASRLKKNK